jgi:hypothetical protein
MKDAIYVVCAAVGLLLVGMGLAQYQAAQTAQCQLDVRSIFRELAPDGLFAQEKSSCCVKVPPATVVELLFGYVLQMVGCALYAERRGRSIFFGLLGLLSPIGYVFLSLLKPASPPLTQDTGVGGGH